jgi:type IV pilus assembly protein PilW
MNMPPVSHKHAGVPLRSSTGLRPFARLQRGFSLIELMVAMTIGLFLLGAVALVYTTTKTGFVHANNTVRMAEDANFALDMISRDVRMASFAGCIGSSVVKTGTPTAVYSNYVPGIVLPVAGTDDKTHPFSSTVAEEFGTIFSARNAVFGFDKNNTAALTALGTSTAYTKSTDYPMLYVAGGSSQAVQLSTVMDATTTSTTSPLAITSDPYKWAADTGKSTYFIVSDCNNAELFRASAVSSSAISHLTPKNTATTFVNLYKSDALVMPLTTSVYFLATSTKSKTPSLYRRYFNGNSANFEEIAPNVEAIDFQYGENTTNNATGDPTYLADTYRTTAATVTDWSRVVSVRIGLILSSEDDGLAPETSKAVPWTNATDFAATSDHRLRRAYSTTVSIRNRMGL